MPKRLSNSPESAMSSLKSITARRRSLLGRTALRGPPAGGAPPQLPLAVSVASGSKMLNLLSRHSRPAPGATALRLTASISTRPSFLPRSSMFSTTMSSAGMLVGGSSSSASTSLAWLAARFRRDSRA